MSKNTGVPRLSGIVVSAVLPRRLLSSLCASALIAASGLVSAQTPGTTNRANEMQAIRAQLEALSERLRRLEQEKRNARKPAEREAKATRKAAEAPAAPAIASDEVEGEEEADDEGKGIVEWSGYLTAVYEQYDFFRNAQDDDPERRARTDLERFALEAESHFAPHWSFEAEAEFEHGGTGSGVEFEPDEFGEFESDIEQGGEVRVEYAYLSWQPDPRIGFRVGQLLVPFGMVNTYHDPTEYFTLRRSLAETALLPNVWSATGVEIGGVLGDFNYGFLVVNGLDSSRFDSPDFIANGAQSRLEFMNADSLAYLGRLDWLGIPGVVLGGSLYYGDTAQNRPLPDIEDDADLFLAEAHGRFERGPWIARGEYVYGSLDNADEIARANAVSANADELGISRLPVGSEAFAWYVEGGYDLFHFFPSFPGRLDAFLRYDDYDTVADVEGDVLDNPSFDRTAKTVGLNYKPLPNVVFKAEYSKRENNGAIANDSDVAGLGLGFEF